MVLIHMYVLKRHVGKQGLEADCDGELLPKLTLLVVHLDTALGFAVAVIMAMVVAIGCFICSDIHPVIANVIAIAIAVGHLNNYGHSHGNSHNPSHGNRRESRAPAVPQPLAATTVRVAAPFAVATVAARLSLLL